MARKVRFAAVDGYAHYQVTHSTASAPGPAATEAAQSMLFPSEDADATEADTPSWLPPALHTVALATMRRVHGTAAQAHQGAQRDVASRDEQLRKLQDEFDKVQTHAPLVVIVPYPNPPSLLH